MSGSRAFVASSRIRARRGSGSNPRGAVVGHLNRRPDVRLRAALRDSLLWVGADDRRSHATTARARQRGISEFVAVANQCRRDRSHLRQARRATEGQAGKTEGFSGRLLEDDSHSLRRIHHRSVPAPPESGEAKSFPVMYANVPTTRGNAVKVALYSRRCRTTF